MYITHFFKLKDVSVKGYGYIIHMNLTDDIFFPEKFSHMIIKDKTEKIINK